MFHVSGIRPGPVEDVEAVKKAWAEFVAAIDRLGGQPFEGYISGGDWVGDDRPQANAFRLSAEEVRLS